MAGVNEYGGGAISALSVAVSALPPHPCSGDFNNDGVINTSDLLLFMSGFGCQGTCTSDMNEDAIVNTADLLLFVALYGSVCT